LNTNIFLISSCNIFLFYILLKFNTNTSISSLWSIIYL